MKAFGFLLSLILMTGVAVLLSIILSHRLRRELRALKEELSMKIMFVEEEA